MTRRAGGSHNGALFPIFGKLACRERGIGLAIAALYSEGSLILSD